MGQTEVARPALREADLRSDLIRAGGLWTEVRVLPETGSTNADVAAAARTGTAEGLVVVAESQYAGRGRLDRTWLAPPRSSLAVSVLLRPAVTAVRLGWLPLLAGVALVDAVRRIAGVDAVLKWPNDLLVRPAGSDAPYGKCAGILAEAVNGSAPVGVVLGIGLNVTQGADELPAGRSGLPATSLLLAGSATADREELLRGLLETFAGWYQHWVATAGDPEASGLAAAYRDACVTLGRQVEVTRPAAGVLAGTAESIDDDGRLVVRTGDAVYPVAAGDVQHVR